MIRTARALLVMLMLVSAQGCEEPRLQIPPNDTFWEVGLWGHGRGVVGDLNVNYFGVQRRCDTCHKVTSNQHGDLGTCNRCHQPHLISWQKSLFPKDHSDVFQLEGNKYHHSLTCKSCHQSMGSRMTYKEVSCNHCHNHGRSDMDFAHELMDDYRYEVYSNNTLCRACHTRVGERYSEFYDTDLHELL